MLRTLLMTALLLIPVSSERCRAKEFRCELRCNEDTKGGTLARLKCYERCREDELYCRRYGDNDP